MTDPDVADVSYGPHERNVFDVFLPRGDRPAATIFFIHGGGFHKGDKANVRLQIIDRCLEAGFAFVSTNYRFSQHAIYPAPYHDCRRALQTVRHRAKEWGIDTQRIGGSGGSAGAGMSTWLAFRQDMADSSARDPVERQPTKLQCCVVFQAQCSYDPRFIKRVVGGPGWKSPPLPQLFGVSEDEWREPFPADKIALFEDSAPINFVEAGAPPVMIRYSTPREPSGDEADEGASIHHPFFGDALKEKMDAVGSICEIVQADGLRHNDELDSQLVGFFLRHLS